jgi:MFS transporter, DHA1 family, multidrug resistance protein
MNRYYDILRNTPGLIALLAVSMLVMGGNGLVAPILSIYATTFSASSALVGMIITIFGLGRLVANMPAGYLTQRFNLDLFLIGGPAVIAVGSVGAALAGDLVTLLIWRFVQGIGSGIFMTASTVTFLKIAKSADVGRVLALHQTALLAGAALGPVMGGLLADKFGLSAPFWGYALVAMAGTIFVWRAGAASQQAYRHDTEEKPVASAGALRSGLFVSICMMNFAIFFTRAASQLTLFPLLGYVVLDLQLSTIGIAMGVSALCNFTAAPIAGYLIERFGAFRIAVLAAMVLVTGLLITGISLSVTGYWVGLILFGAASGINSTSITTLVTEHVPRPHYGSAMGLMRTFGDMGFVAGPMIAGSVGELFGIGIGGAIIFNAGLVGAVTLGLMLARHKGSGGVGTPPDTGLQRIL